MAASRLSGCPSVTVLPVGAVVGSATSPVKHRDFAAVAAAYLDFAALAAANTNFDDISEGHPGYPGGPPEISVGSGVRWGWEEDGVEWWITDAEGLDDSAPWEAAITELAADDGGVVEAVRAKGRQVTLRGRLISDDKALLAVAKRLAAATLAVQPRIGWLDYEGLRLPVALAGQTQVRPVGGLAADVEMTLVGAEIGTPGGGVFFEGATSSVALPWGVAQPITISGAVPAFPIITLVGPIPQAADITVGGAVIALNRPVAAAEVLTIDCRRRLVTSNGKPDRGAVSLNAWPRLSGTVVASASTANGVAPAGRASMSATDLY